MSVTDHSFLDSDNLVWLRPMLERSFERFPGLTHSLQVTAVIDTSELLPELEYQVARRKDPSARSNLEELLDNKTVVGFIPSRADQEVLEHLPELAGRTGKPLELYRTAWLALRAKLHVLDVLDPSNRTWARDLRDPEDADFVALAERQDAIIFTRDHDMRDTDAPTLRLVEVVVDLREYARSRSIVLTVLVQGLQLSSVASNSVATLSAALVRSLRSLPLWVQLALLVVGAKLVFSRPRLRRVRDFGCQLLQIAGEKLLALATFLSTSDAKCRQHEAVLQAKLPTKPCPSDTNSSAQRTRVHSQPFPADVLRAARLQPLADAHSQPVLGGKSTQAANSLESPR